MGFCDIKSVTINILVRTFWVKFVNNKKYILVTDAAASYAVHSGHGGGHDRVNFRIAAGVDGQYVAVQVLVGDAVVEGGEELAALGPIL
jgi:hypothetical protein